MDREQPKPEPEPSLSASSPYAADEARLRREVRAHSWPDLVAAIEGPATGRDEFEVRLIHGPSGTALGIGTGHALEAAEIDALEALLDLQVSGHRPEGAREAFEQVIAAAVHRAGDGLARR